MSIITITPEGFQIDCSKLKEMKWVDFVYEDSHYAVRKLKDGGLQFGEFLTNYDKECLYYDASVGVKNHV